MKSIALFPVLFLLALVNDSNGSAPYSKMDGANEEPFQSKVGCNKAFWSRLLSVLDTNRCGDREVVITDISVPKVSPGEVRMAWKRTEQGIAFSFFSSEEERRAWEASTQQLIVQGEERERKLAEAKTLNEVYEKELAQKQSEIQQIKADQQLAKKVFGGFMTVAGVIIFLWS